MLQSFSHSGSNSSSSSSSGQVARMTCLRAVMSGVTTHHAPRKHHGTPLRGGRRTKQQKKTI